MGGRAEDAVPMFDAIEDQFQKDYSFLDEVASKAFKTILEYYNSEDLLYYVYGWVVGKASTLAMKDFEEPLTVTATEAMHFQRGLHYLSVRAAEMIAPIPELEDGTPDWTVVQEVVWD